MSEAAASVLVGVDGSEAAANAAVWAVEEALSRSVPLTLVSATGSVHPSADGYQRQLARAEASLRAARAAVEATDRPVKVVSSETAIGQPAAVLVARSRDADLICVGSVGIGGYARVVIGSTAADLAERAQCPVAVIRPDHHNAPGAVRWIAVAATGAAEDEVVIAAAMREARLRRLPVLLLGPHQRRGGAGADLDSAVAQCGNGATTSTSIPWPAAAMSRASFATTMNRSN